MYDESFDRRLGALFLAEAALVVPEGTSVRSAIAGRLGQRPQAFRPSALLIAGLVVIALAVLLAATPARGLLPFGWIRFGTVVVTPTPNPAWGTYPQSGAASEGHALPKLTLAQAQQLARFQIPQPAVLPPGVEFRFAYASTDGSWVSLAYGLRGDQSRGMGIQMQRGKPSGYYRVPASGARTVKVNGDDAIYWKRPSDEGLLSWKEGDFTYVMQYSGLGLSKDDMIRIAESMG
jgi:hypothetical protein